MEDSISSVVVSEAQQSSDSLRVLVARERVLQVSEGGGGAHDGQRDLHPGADRDGEAASHNHHGQEHQEEANHDSNQTRLVSLQPSDWLENWQHDASHWLEDQETRVCKPDGLLLHVAEGRHHQVPPGGIGVHVR